MSSEIQEGACASFCCAVCVRCARWACQVRLARPVLVCECAAGPAAIRRSHGAPRRAGVIDSIPHRNAPRLIILASTSKSWDREVRWSPVRVAEEEAEVRTLIRVHGANCPQCVNAVRDKLLNRPQSAAST
jgi:hypothetical protein